MNCANCGWELAGNEAHCPNCGQPVKVAPPPTTAPPQPTSSQPIFNTPTGQTAPMQQSHPPPRPSVAHVPNYLVQAILVTLFCCQPLGIVSIVYAAQVNSKLAQGDNAGAMQASNNAKTFAWIAFGLGLFVNGGGGLFYLLAALGSM